MPTFADDILTEAGDEPIKRIVIGPFRNYHEMYKATYDEAGNWIPEEERQLPKWANRPITWEKALPILSYDYNRGYGLADCHPIAAYTATRVIFVSTYDGATELNSVPRNPIAHEPIIPGGE